MPALFTRISIRPNAARVHSTMVVRAGREVTSVGTTLARRPRACTSAAVRSALARSSSATTMSAPRRASSRAVARPMPRPAPVTMATCPSSSIPPLLWLTDAPGTPLAAACSRSGRRHRHGHHAAKQHVAVVTYAFDLPACLEQLQMGQRFTEHQPVVEGIMAIGKRLLGNRVGGLGIWSQDIEHRLQARVVMRQEFIDTPLWIRE